MTHNLRQSSYVDITGRLPSCDLLLNILNLLLKFSVNFLKSTSCLSLFQIASISFTSLFRQLEISRRRLIS